MTDEPREPRDEGTPGEPRIRVDTDWKKRARAERLLGEDPPGVEEAAAGPRRRERPPLPEPTLAAHVSQLAAEAAVALGDVEHPASGRRQPDLELAKYLIDTLAMLQKKTEGNRDETESRLLDEALYQLRLRYVALTRPSAGP